MKLLPGDFKKLQISLCSSLLMLALGGPALYLMYDGYRLALRERAAAQSQRNEQSGKLQRARAEEHEIMEKISLFQSLQQRGVIGPEQRLDWVELLRDIRDKRQLIELSYEIEPQRPLDTPVDAGLAFKVSPMTVRLKLLHEEDLIRFLSDLHLRAGALTRIKGCKLTRQTPGDTQASVRGNLLGECRIDWITLQETAKP